MKPDRVTKDAKGKDEPSLPSPKRSSGFAQAGHAGHRQRLKARFLKGGAEALPDYEMLELLLFQALFQPPLETVGGDPGDHEGDGNNGELDGGAED